MTTPDQTTLEIISDWEAFIVKGDARWKLEGGLAAEIIWSWRHLKGHPGTGDQDAALYLWGLTAGLRHSGLTNTQMMMDTIRQNRELVAELKIRDLMISDLQNRLAPYEFWDASLKRQARDDDGHS